MPGNSPVTASPSPRACTRWLRFAVLAALALLTAGAVSAAEKVYTVANYPVESSAENAVKAKDKALAEGQQAAFRSLLKRLIPVTLYARAKQLDNVRAADLVEAVRVRAE